MIGTVARTNVYNREQGESESGAEEMKRDGGREARGEVSGVCAFGVCYKIVYTVIHTQRHMEPRFL